MPRALFDGHCFICRSSRSVIQSLDWMNRVEFIDLHDPETLSRCPELDDAWLMGEIHVLDGGSLHVGYDGIRRLLKEVPLGIPIWLLLGLPGMDRIGRRVYRFIVRRRYSINRLVGGMPSCADGSCKMPPTS